VAPFVGPWEAALIALCPSAEINVSTLGTGPIAKLLPAWSTDAFAPLVPLERESLSIPFAPFASTHAHDAGVAFRAGIVAPVAFVAECEVDIATFPA
jgi:hypothetical protein